MDSTTAKQFGVIDKVVLLVFLLDCYCGFSLVVESWSVYSYCMQILWRGQEKIMADVASPEDWDKNAGIKVADEI